MGETPQMKRVLLPQEWSVEIEHAEEVNRRTLRGVTSPFVRACIDVSLMIDQFRFPRETYRNDSVAQNHTKQPQRYMRAVSRNPYKT